MPDPYFWTISDGTVSRRRVRNFVCWKVAVGKIQDSGPESVQYCLDRYDLCRGAYSKTIAAMINTILSLGYMFEVDRSPSPPVRLFGCELGKLRYHDDSPTRESMENLGIDLTHRIGTSNSSSKSHSGDSWDDSIFNLNFHFSDRCGRDNTHSGAMTRRSAARAEDHEAEVCEDAKNVERNKNAN